MKNMDIAEIQDYTLKLLEELDRVCRKNDITYFLVCGSALGAIRHQGHIPWDYDVDITVPLPQMSKFCECMKRDLNKEFRLVLPGEEQNTFTTFPRMGYKRLSTKFIHIDIFPSIGISSNKEEQEKLVKKTKLLKTIYKMKSLSTSKEGNIVKVIIKNTVLRVLMLPFSKEKVLKKFYNECEKYPYESSEFVTNPCGRYGKKNIIPKSYFGNPQYKKYLHLELPVPDQIDLYLKHYYGEYMKYPAKEECEKMLKKIFIVEEV